MQGSQCRILGCWSPAMPDTTRRCIGGMFSTCLQQERRGPPVRSTRAHKATIYLSAQCDVYCQTVQLRAAFTSIFLRFCNRGERLSRQNSITRVLVTHTHSIGRAPNIYIPRELGG